MRTWHCALSPDVHFFVCSAGTRKELRSSRSDTSQCSTYSGLKWLSWPKGTSLGMQMMKWWEFFMVPLQTDGCADLVSSE